MPVNNKDINKPEKEAIPIISFETAELWEQWLDDNYTSYYGIWLRFYKKNSRQATVTYDEALDVALCFGWIDGQVKKYDEVSYIQKFTPRRAKSQWSKRNVDKVTDLIDAGRMKAPGYDEIERAKADGRWAKAYDSPSKMTIPEDFIEELKQHKEAHAFFKTLDKTNLYSIGYRLQTAKDEATLNKRKRLIIEMMKRLEKFH